MNQSNKELAQELLDVIHELVDRPTPWEHKRDTILELADDNEKRDLTEILNWFADDRGQLLDIDKIQPVPKQR